MHGNAHTPLLCESFYEQTYPPCTSNFIDKKNPLTNNNQIKDQPKNFKH